MVSRQAQRRALIGPGGLMLALAFVLGSAIARPALAAPSAPAQPGQSANVSQKLVQLNDDCARLRAELERAQADIAALKRGDRGVRDDYRLRRRMADAEQLARQLTAAEAELRRLHPGARPATPAPASGPAEAPAVLEARADVLSDQARRLSQQAASFERAAGQLRARQTLRRRAGQVERDPFGAMDSSKRFMVAGGQTRAGNTDSKATGTTGSGDSTQPPTTPPAGFTNNPPPAGQGGAAPGSATSAPAPQTTPPPTPPTGPEGTRSTTGTNPGTTVSDPAIGSRALLDPALAAELRGLEGAVGSGLGDADKLEKAAAALQKRAQGLETEAQALRARAAKR